MPHTPSHGKCRVIVCRIRFLSFLLPLLTIGFGPLRTLAAETTFIPEGAVWTYLDQGFDPGPDWPQADFDDHFWLRGKAKLGYGEGDENTIVSFGTNSANKHVTTFFRRGFRVFHPERFTNLVLRLKRDDGAVVYLNGNEVYRDNLPEGPITFGQFASMPAPDDGATFTNVTISVTNLLAIDNMIAVEIHQATAGSSDLSFDLELTADGSGPPTPALTLTELEVCSILSWPREPDDFTLQSSDSIGPSATWTDVTEPIFTTADHRLITNVFGSPALFYRLESPGTNPPCQPPFVTNQPLILSPTPGTNLTLTVEAEGTAPLLFQWRLNQRLLDGETANSLTLTNYQRTNGGTYDCLVANACGAIVSDPIRVKSDDAPTTFTDTLTNSLLIPGTAFSSTNFLTFQGFNTNATVDPAEPALPSGGAGRTVWIRLETPADGVLTVDTDGSGQRTVLALYSGTNTTNFLIQASAANNQPNLTSRVQLNAVAGTVYSIGMDGAGLDSTLCLNALFEVGAPFVPQIVSQPQNQYAMAGDPASFSVIVTNHPSEGPPAFTYQWRINGDDIVGAAESMLLIPVTAAADVGMYSVLINGTILSQRASLTLETEGDPLPPELDELSRSPSAGGTVGPATALRTGTILIAIDGIPGNGTVPCSANGISMVSIISTNFLTPYTPNNPQPPGFTGISSPLYAGLLIYTAAAANFGIDSAMTLRSIPQYYQATCSLPVCVDDIPSSCNPCLRELTCAGFLFCTSPQLGIHVDLFAKPGTCGASNTRVELKHVYTQNFPIWCR